MNRFSFNCYLLSIIALLTSTCGNSSNNKKEKPISESEPPSENFLASKYLIELSKIDNRAIVYLNDSLIFDSGTIDKSPTVNFQIPLDDYVRSSQDTVKVALFNGYLPYNSDQSDPAWEINYSFLIDGELVDFIHESGRQDTVGLVYEGYYILEEWEQ